jgi:hypothetical protein
MVSDTIQHRQGSFYENQIKKEKKTIFWLPFVSINRDCPLGGADLVGGEAV